MLQGGRQGGLLALIACLALTGANFRRVDADPSEWQYETVVADMSLLPSETTPLIRIPLTGVEGVAWLPPDNLLILDRSAHALWEVRLDLGHPYLLLGTSSLPGYNSAGLAAGFFYPSSVASDPLGRFALISDAGHNRVMGMWREAAPVAAGLSCPGPAFLCWTPPPPSRFGPFESLAREWLSQRLGAYPSLVVLERKALVPVAGNGSNGWAGDGGPALQANVTQPCAVALDPFLKAAYVAEGMGSRIRAFPVPTGVIQTVAGNRNAAHLGDGGSGTAASMIRADAMVVALDGSVFFADSRAHVVRRWDPNSRIVERYAGTGGEGRVSDGLQATEIGLNTPMALAVDLRGNLFVGDTGQNLIFRIDALSRTVEILTAGAEAWVPQLTGNCSELQFVGEISLNVSLDGDLYVGDGGSRCVRRLRRRPQVAGPAGPAPVSTPSAIPLSSPVPRDQLAVPEVASAPDGSGEAAVTPVRELRPEAALPLNDLSDRAEAPPGVTGTAVTPAAPELAPPLPLPAAPPPRRLDLAKLSDTIATLTSPDSPAVRQTSGTASVVAEALLRWGVATQDVPPPADGMTVPFPAAAGRGTDPDSMARLLERRLGARPHTLDSWDLARSLGRPLCAEVLEEDDVLLLAAPARDAAESGTVPDPFASRLRRPEPSFPAPRPASRPPSGQPRLAFVAGGFVWSCATTGSKQLLSGMKLGSAETPVLVRRGMFVNPAPLREDTLHRITQLGTSFRGLAEITARLTRTPPETVIPLLDGFGDSVDRLARVWERGRWMFACLLCCVMFLCAGRYAGAESARAPGETDEESGLRLEWPFLLTLAALPLGQVTESAEWPYEGAESLMALALLVLAWLPSAGPAVRAYRGSSLRRLSGAAACVALPAILGAALSSSRAHLACGVPCLLLLGAAVPGMRNGSSLLPLLLADIGGLLLAGAAMAHPSGPSPGVSLGLGFALLGWLVTTFGRTDGTRPLPGVLLIAAGLTTLLCDRYDSAVVSQLPWSTLALIASLQCLNWICVVQDQREPERLAELRRWACLAVNTALLTILMPLLEFSRLLAP